MSKFTIIRLQPFNISYLYLLFEAVYAKPCPAKYFDLKYDTGYTGVNHIGFLAFDKQKPIAFYGVVPLIVSLQNKDVLAAQACDAMTHPDYRNRGLFFDLVTQTLDLAKDEGIHLVFGFPNQNSYPLLIHKLGFKNLETMNRYTIHFSENLFKRIYRKLFFAKLKTAQPSMTNFLIEEGYDGIKYSTKYLAYKMACSDSQIVRKNQKDIWLNLSGGGWVGSASAKTMEDLEKVLYILKSYVKASSITFMISPNTLFDTLLSQIISREEGFAVIIKNLSGIYDTDHLKFQFCDIDVF